MDTSLPAVRTGAVVALKPTSLAKSRLGTLADPLRRRLAWCMAVDTLAALSAAVGRLLVVGDQPALASRLLAVGLSVEVAPDPPERGMNAALGHGDRLLRDQGVTRVLACVGDLPALRPDSVRRVLAAAALGSRSFVADASGVGTTMLVGDAVPLQPHFQGASAAAHARSGAQALLAAELGDVADARCDVDTEADLAAAVPLGLGAHTRSLVDPATSRLGDYTLLTVTEAAALPPDVLDPGVGPVAGRRLHAVTSGVRVLSAWA